MTFSSCRSRPPPHLQHQQNNPRAAIFPELPLETYYDVERDYLQEALIRVAFSKTVGLKFSDM